MPQLRIHTMPLSMALLVLSFISCFASGCTRNTSFRSWVHNRFKVGAEYSQPGADLELQWIDMASDPRLVPETPDLARWWEVFGDPVLDGLVLTAYNENLPIRQAAFRIEQAEAIRQIAVGTLFPQAQQGIGDFRRVELSRNVAVPLPLPRFSEFGVGVQAGWELDFWGRFRRGVAVADAALDASIADYDNLAVLFLANVAATYMEIRIIEEQLDLVRNILQLQQGSMELAETLFAAGKTNELDVIQARNNIAITMSVIPQFEAALRNANNRLCVLLGSPPTDLAAQLPPGKIPEVARDVHVGFPADLLRRRPDIRRAERLLRAQSERIGIAEAALYPRLTLLGSFEWRAESTGDLFKPDSVFALISPGFAWNILNYGRLSGAIDLEEARFREAVLGYQQTVLVAQQEVEDAMVRFLKAQEQADLLGIAVSEVNASVDIAIALYEAGAIDFNRVFLLQSLQFAQQIDLVTSRGATVLNLIATFRALGGGWEIRCPAGGMGAPLVNNVTTPTIGSIPKIERPRPEALQLDDPRSQPPKEDRPMPASDSKGPVGSDSDRLKQLLERLNLDQRKRDDRGVQSQLDDLMIPRDQRFPQQ
jgi:NodT family efflux transporter outer membrane factor (OMF) lipoprotein